MVLIGPSPGMVITDWLNPGEKTEPQVSGYRRSFSRAPFLEPGYALPEAWGLRLGEIEVWLQRKRGVPKTTNVASS